MTTRKISHARGKGSMNHNNRNHIYGNVDASKTENNIFYAKENIEDAYQKCFGEALANYNAKQKRADRKIKNYYTHLFGNAQKDTVATSSNKEKSFYEIVVGIGDRNTCAVDSADGELAVKILDEYAKGFSERNLNFYVFNSVMHLDEKTPHMHIDYIPIADGYKNGLTVRNSQSIALQQMGFGKNKNSISEWRIQERKILRELCQQYGLEIAEETQGRGKTFTPDEYKKIRDEAKDELQADPEIMGEIKDEIKQEATAELQADISAEKAKLEKAKAQLERESLQIEGKIALEQRIQKLIDGTQEKNLFGKTKTTITFEGTAEEAMTVLKAAQQSAKDRANAKNFKAERDSAVSERDDAVKARELAEKQKSTAEKAAKTAESRASAKLTEADGKMAQATALYSQQQNLNSLYRQAVSDRDKYKTLADRVAGLENQINELQESLRNAYASIGAMTKAIASLLFDPDIKLTAPTPAQERLLQAIRNYAGGWAETAGFADIAEDIQNHYGISKGIQSHIDELMPKPQTKKRSYGHELG